LPDSATLAELSELARGGDIDALRERIAALLAVGSAGENFLRHLDELAAAFRTGEIRQQLDHARSRP